MKHVKTCCYKHNTHFNLFPAVLVTVEENHFIIAFKFLQGHLGFKFERAT